MKDIREDIRQINRLQYDNNIVEFTENQGIPKEINENNFENDSQPQNYEEIKVDYDGILILYLAIGEMKPTVNLDNPNIDPKIYQKNYFISHKVFPDVEVSTSDILWSTIRPNFNYQLSMPFTINQKNLGLIDGGTS